MNIAISYFSGTGNTKKIADAYVEALCGAGASVTMFNMEKGEAPREEFDLYGFFYPVWAFNAPVVVLDYAKSLEKTDGTRRAFIVKTSGEPVRMNDASSIKLKKILKKRGYTVFFERRYVMPYNIIFRHTDAMAHRMWTAAKSIIPLDCKALFDGEAHTPKRVPFGGLITAILRIQQWGGRFNGRRYKTTGECVGCNKCVNSCPARNITVADGKIKFGKNCLMCMRCSFYCPKNAIKIGLFNKWKVNGAYSFEPPKAQEPATKHDKYCKKAYDRYFSDIEKRLTEMNEAPLARHEE